MLVGCVGDIEYWCCVVVWVQSVDCVGEVFEVILIVVGVVDFEESDFVFVDGELGCGVVQIGLVQFVCEECVYCFGVEEWWILFFF